MAEQNGESTGEKGHQRQTLRPASRGKLTCTFDFWLLTVHSEIGSLIAVRFGSSLYNRRFCEGELSRLLSPQPRIGVVGGEATLKSLGTVSSQPELSLRMSSLFSSNIKYTYIKAEGQYQGD